MGARGISAHKMAVSQPRTCLLPRPLSRWAVIRPMVRPCMILSMRNCLFIGTQIQNSKKAPGGPKMANGVWKSVHPQDFERSCQYVFDPSTPSMRKGGSADKYSRWQCQLVQKCEKFVVMGGVGQSVPDPWMLFQGSALVRPLERVLKK